MGVQLPTQIKRMRGTLQPCYTNPNEPQPTEPLGDPPPYFERDEKAVWRELVRIVVAGVLTVQDRFVAETLCLLMAKMRRRETLAGAERAQLSTCLSRMGMTPSDRAKVIAVPKADQDDISQFLQ